MIRYFFRAELDEPTVSGCSVLIPKYSQNVWSKGQRPVFHNLGLLIFNGNLHKSYEENHPYPIFFPDVGFFTKLSGSTKGMYREHLHTTDTINWARKKVDLRIWFSITVERIFLLQGYGLVSRNRKSAS